jgi:uncharacterized membrane protein
MIAKIMDNSAYAVIPSWAIAIGLAWVALVIAISLYLFASQTHESKHTRHGGNV